jgi:hypothetical protein
MKIAMLCAFSMLALIGCALSQADRDSIILESSKQAGEFAAQAAYQKVHDALIAQGKSEEEAVKAAREAAGVAQAAASAVAGKTAELATNKAQAAQSSSAGGWIAALLPALLGLAGAAGKKLLGGV